MQVYIYTNAYIYMHTIYIQNIHTKHDKTERTWKHTCSVHKFCSDTISENMPFAHT